VKKTIIAILFILLGAIDAKAQSSVSVNLSSTYANGSFLAELLPPQNGNVALTHTFLDGNGQTTILTLLPGRTYGFWATKTDGSSVLYGRVTVTGAPQDVTASLLAISSASGSVVKAPLTEQDINATASNFPLTITTSGTPGFLSETPLFDLEETLSGTISSIHTGAIDFLTVNPTSFSGAQLYGHTSVAHINGSVSLNGAFVAGNYGEGVYSGTVSDGTSTVTGGLFLGASTSSGAPGNLFGVSGTYDTGSLGTLPIAFGAGILTPLAQAGATISLGGGLYIQPQCGSGATYTACWDIYQVNQNEKDQLGNVTSCSLNGLIYVTTGGCYTTLQAAITALGSSPGTVIVPPGTFTTTSTTTLTASDQHIIGSGMGSSVISYTGGGAITAVLDIGTSTGGGAANQWNNSVEGLTISGNANVTNAIRTRGVHHATFRNLDLRNVTGDGIDTNFAVVGEYDNIHCSLNDATFVVQPTNCIHLDGPNASAKTTASTVKNLVAEGVSGSGLLLGQAIEVKVIAGTSEQNAIGVSVSANAESISLDGIDLESNSSEDILNNGIGLYVKGNSGCYSTTKLVAGSTSQISSYEIGNNTCIPTINAGAVEVTSPAGVLGGTTPNNLQFLSTATTCTTGAAIGAICTTGTITLPFAEQDTNYRLVCTGLGPTNVPIVQTVTKSSASFTITIAALTAAAASFSSYDCILGHN
jgi:hypothetical protein